MNRPGRPIPSVLLSLYACELGLLGFVLGTRKLAGSAWWTLDGPLAVGTAVSAALLLLGAGALLLSLPRCRGSGVGSRVRFTLLLNAFTVAMALLLGELSLRVLAVETPRGVSVFGRELLPYSWNTLSAHHRAQLGNPANDRTPSGNYRIHDAELGWTVGPSRSNPAHLCHSSREGIRSRAPGISYTEAAKGKRIIALVGDSYTFGLDVSFEDSWAGRLQEQLGEDYVVLNFGVDGYGNGQAYLRYLRDVLPWHAEVVVFGMIQHDFMRSLVVYPFLAFPTWDLPFSKPLFELRRGALRVCNTPLAPPGEIFERPSIEEIPHLEREPAYVSADWEPTPLDGSYLVRLLRTRFRPDRDLPDTSSAELYGPLNAAILHAFRERCAAEGSKPLLVYFPTNGAGDFPETARGRPSEGGALRTLAGHQLPFVDVTPALRALPVDRRFLPQGHYTPAGNAAAAGAIHAALLPMLGH